MDTVDAIVAAAEAELHRGEPLSAYNTTQSGLERAPRHVRLRQLQALALARGGDVGRANAILEELMAEGNDDAETMGMLARTHKDLASGTVGDERAAHLRSAFELYERAYHAAIARGDTQGAGYTGINAAAMAALRGDIARARELAAGVRSGKPMDGYWGEATLGEAALIMGEVAAAREHYARAARIAGRSYGDLASTRRQARLLESCLPDGAGGAADALAVPHVIAYSGHMIDAPDRPQPRFPASSEPRVRASVREALASAPPVAVYGSAACGADLIFLEAARELDCETHVILPFPAPAFREASVDFAGGDWPRRFESALAAAHSVTVTSDHLARGSTATFEYANLVLTGMASLRARLLDTSMRAIAVSASGAGGPPGGTASILSLWKRRAVPIDEIELPRVTPTNAAVEIADRDRQAAGTGTRHEMRALLFADAVGYSKLTEDQIPVYIERFLGAVAQLAHASTDRFEHVETAGDGLYMVFADPGAAGRFALELSALAADTDWAAHGLPAGLNLRVALHCGPVHCGRDPLTGRPIYTGPHTSRAARIEPITPPGQVYASSAYAAVVAATSEDLMLTYVGRMPLAKGYGTLGLYHVRRER